MKSCFARRVGPCQLAILDVTAESDGKSAFINRVNVPRNFRGQGIATELLKECIAAAAAEGVTLKLWPSPSDGLNFEQLVAWYGQHGFVRNSEGIWERKPTERN